MAKALLYEFEYNNGANKMQLFENRIVMTSKVGGILVSPISKIAQIKKITGTGALQITFGAHKAGGVGDFSLPMLPDGSTDKFFLLLQELL